MTRNIYMNRYADTYSGLRFGLLRLIGHWRGNVFKLICTDILLFGVLFAALSILYRIVLMDYPVYRHTFEVICVYAERFSDLIPMTLITGFYVTQVVSRWWDQFMTLNWPDTFALKLVSYVPGADPFKKNLRKTVMRYVNLSTVLVYRLVSHKVSKRFPDYESLMDSKLLLPHEAERLLKAESRTPHETTWVPILWAMRLLQRARADGKITVEPPLFNGLLTAFEPIEINNRKILNYGWINFPVAYTQVVTISVYAYFCAALFGRQNLYPSDGTEGNSTEIETDPLFANSTIFYTRLGPFAEHTPDMYVPLFTLLELFCYVGWIKVAVTLLNPFGDDDEDFKVNYLIDRNLQVSYLIVDEADTELEMAEDPFQEAGISIPPELPYPNNKPELDLEEDEEDAAMAFRNAMETIRRNSISFLSFHKLRSAASTASVHDAFTLGSGASGSISGLGSIDKLSSDRHGRLKAPPSIGVTPSSPLVGHDPRRGSHFITMKIDEDNEDASSSAADEDHEDHGEQLEPLLQPQIPIIIKESDSK